MSSSLFLARRLPRVVSRTTTTCRHRFLSSFRTTSFTNGQRPSPFLIQPRRYLTTEQRDQLQTAVKQSPVVLFMKGTLDQPQCGFSRAVVQILGLHQVSPEKVKSYNVLESPELRQNIKEFSDWPTIPQLYVNGEFIGGCDIILGMHQSGELESLLEKEGIIPKVDESEDSATATAAAA